MSMPLPDPRSIRLPPVPKQQYTCHGYTAYQGSGQPWTCPACGKAYGAEQSAK